MALITIGDTIEASSVVAEVQASSITTANEMRDSHLKSADFLDLEHFPDVNLKSTKITAKGGDSTNSSPTLPSGASPSP